MAKDHMRYDAMAQEALRGVVRLALSRAAREGLLGDHHFYIAFRTRYPGVHMSELLRNRYPEEMTVVLQHQFWNLIVEDDWFEVDLTFNKIPEHLRIPFKSIKGFLDPSVEFGLQFPIEGDDTAVLDTATGMHRAGFGDNALGQEPPMVKADSADAFPDALPNDDAELDDDESGQVVSLDAFRKK